MARPEKASIFQRIEGLPIILVFLVILLLFMYLAPEVFLRPFQYTTFLSTLPPVMLLAIGLTFIIGAGEIDLSFPAVLGFSGFLFAIIFKQGQDWIVSATGTPENGFLASPLASELIRWGGVVAALLAGVLIGFINGVLVAKIGIPSFIATLGTQFFWYGMATVLSGGKSYALRGAEDSTVWRALVGRPFSSSSVDWLQQVPIQSLWTALIIIFMWFLLNRHRFGEHAMFIGDSNPVSRVVGIDVDREKIKLFTMMGFLAAIAAIFMTLEVKNYFGNQGQGYLLIAIASVLIGGTSIFGGRATIIGTVFGCFIIAIVEPGLVAAGLTGAWVNTVRGLIFLISIIFYLYIDEPHRRGALLTRLVGVRASDGGNPAEKQPESAATGRR
ncbi:MAG: ABC transporter permease [Hyphomicrobiales bacterium]|jgi:simple sugar transport system permease protein|nr:ABC transporter permease [Hyphomicrobiales bacterium]